MKRILLPLLVAIVAMVSLTCTSCGKRKQPTPPVIVQAPDYKPIGEGIKVHSYALIGIAAIIMVGLIVRKGNH